MIEVGSDVFCIPSESMLRGHLTVSVTGGWGEEGLETANRHSSEQAPKNAQSPSRPVHALLGGGFRWDLMATVLRAASDF